MRTIGRARWQSLHPSSVKCVATAPRALQSERMERWPSDVQYRRRELLNRSVLVGVVARRAQASKTRGSELFSGSHTTIGLRHGPKQRETSRFRTVFALFETRCSNNVPRMCV